ncbi:HEC/Ndc80p family-domain-containing protein [Gamsiella multidivaricata]|uniref:HEC/Ndc80p family-domain-containing protein n=1 Tax=Gamsiella multidivaricata TaxID=101098 RepID=UPI00222044A4|nr:HEC/Ndc80p family-domain-containing protein [Gamsiella multidivaricata]KAI7830403.1 HEC/Ndc80p family-domain-containing protein [Gamsiella multidivaricata]
MNDNRRESSFGFRQSFNGTGSGGFPTLTTNVNLKEPRPIKDKTYMRNLINNLVNFLTETGYPHPITTKNLLQPTNKDFQDTFKFLYSKMEPGYDFQKKFEDEVPVLLKSMRYPAADTISKTSLYTVGTPHSWPNMLALLGWMMESILALDSYKEIMDMPQYNSRHGRDLDPKLDMTLVSADDALYYYLIKTYRVWMVTGNLQDLDLEAQLAASFQIRGEFAEDEAKRQAEINDALRQELEVAQAEVSPLIALEREQQVLLSDIERFKKAIDHAEPRIEEIRRANEDTRRTISSRQIKLGDLANAKAELQEIVRTQTTTRAGLDNKLEERNRLRRREDSLNQQLQDLENELRTLDKRRQDGEIEAERLAKEYNELAVKIGIVPRSAKHANGQDYELRLDLDNVTSGKLYSVDIKGKTERTISALRTQLVNSTNETSNELFVLKEELDRLKDQVEESVEELNSKEYQLNLQAKKYQDDKEAARAELMNRQVFAESQQEQIQAMIQETIQNQAEDERIEQENIFLERQAGQNRETYTRGVKTMLGQLTAVKQHVEQQAGLVLNMAHKELEDTQQTRNHVSQVLVVEASGERNGLEGVERDLLFSSA